jgi:hypothetical protein
LLEKRGKALLFLRSKRLAAELLTKSVRENGTSKEFSKNYGTPYYGNPLEEPQKQQPPSFNPTSVHPLKQLPVTQVNRCAAQKSSLFKNVPSSLNPAGFAIFFVFPIKNF